MKCSNRPLLRVAGIIVVFAVSAMADTICTVPTSVALNVLPVGCQIYMTNGQISYSNVVDQNGDLHNVTISSLDLSVLNTSADTVVEYLAGTDNDITANTTNNFSGFSTGVQFNTALPSSPSINNYTVTANTGQNSLILSHLINSNLGRPGILKLNFGFGNSALAVTADTTTSAGNYTISLQGQVFTELNLTGNSSGPYSLDSQGSSGVSFAIENATPEPGTVLLFAAGLAGIGVFVKRQRVFLIPRGSCSSGRH